MFRDVDLDSILTELQPSYQPTTGCSKIFLAVLLVNPHIGIYNTLYHHISIIMIHPRIVFDLSLSFIQTKVMRVRIDTFDDLFIQ